MCGRKLSSVATNTYPSCACQLPLPIQKIWEVGSQRYNSKALWYRASTHYMYWFLSAVCTFFHILAIQTFLQTHKILPTQILRHDESLPWSSLAVLLISAERTVHSEGSGHCLIYITVMSSWSKHGLESSKFECPFRSPTHSCYS